jgi:hypothetical protein
MLKFATMTQSQRLFVVDPDFRIFLGKRFPAFCYPSFKQRLVREAYEDSWLEDQVTEYLSELGSSIPVRDGASFALDTLLAFNIGRLAVWHRANELMIEAEGCLISSKEYDEHLSLLCHWSEIEEWARDVYGVKIP